MSEYCEEVQLVNQRGLHARASAKFVTLVSKLPDEILVSVEKDGTRIAGTSIMGLMMLGAAKGDNVVIHVSGPEADSTENALAKLAGLVKDGFGED